MALEIEAKLRVESHEPIREKLRSLGAEPRGQVLESNVILDSADGSLRKRGCGLRIRTNQTEGSGASKTILTFKGPVIPGTFKTREEQEVEVGDAGAAIRVLAALGYVRILAYEKRRESWVLRNCKIELDEPPHIGLFVEIEGPTEDAVHKVLERLGLLDHAHVAASYVRMLSEYCNQNGLNDYNLTHIAARPPSS